MSPKRMQRLTIVMPLGALLIAGAEVGYQYSRCASLREQIRVEVGKHKTAPSHSPAAREHQRS